MTKISYEVINESFISEIKAANCDQSDSAFNPNMTPEMIVCEEHTSIASLANMKCSLAQEPDQPATLPCQLNTPEDSTLEVTLSQQTSGVEETADQDDCVIDAVVFKADKVYEEIAILSDDEMSNHSIPDINHSPRISSDDCLIVSDRIMHTYSPTDFTDCITLDDDIDAIEDSSSSTTSNECIVIDDEEDDCREICVIAKDDVDPQISQAFLCAKEDYVNGLRNLSASGFDLNCRNSKRWTLLMMACFTGSISVVKYLLSQKVDLYKKDKHNNSALSLASKRGHKKIIIMIQLQMRVGSISKNCEMKEFYCKICKMKISRTTKTKHELSIVHLSKIDPPKPHNSFHIGEANIGYQILMKCGWNGKTGLGKNEQGNKYPILVEAKNKRSGLGHENNKYPEELPDINRTVGYKKGRKPKAGPGEFYCKLCQSIIEGKRKIHVVSSVIHQSKARAKRESKARAKRASGKSPNDEETPSLLRQTQPSLPPDSFQLPAKNIGYQMLLKSGWDGKSGLGKDSQGKRFPIETETKNNRLGLGHEKDASDQHKTPTNKKRIRFKLPKRKSLKSKKSEEHCMMQLYRRLLQ